MKPLLRLKQGVLIALVLLIGLVVVATATVVSINQQRNDVLEQSVAARKISRLSTRMLVLTHTASEYMTETNIRQWWVVHQSISDELDHLHFSDESGEISTRLEERLSDFAALFSGFSHMLTSQEIDLDERRSSVLTDRLISEAEQLAELSYKVSDSAFARYEELTHKRKAIVLIFALLFGMNSFLLLLLIRYRVVKPLAQIENVANAMRAGDLNARCNLPEGDELGDVAAALDSLALELYNRLADLTSTTHLLEVAGRMCGVGAWTLDVNTHALSWSKQIYDIVEADFTHQPTLEEAIALYPEDSAAKLSKALEDATRAGCDVNIELQLRTYKGKLIWVHVFGEVIWRGDGAQRKPWMIRGAFQNITERRRVEEEIRQAKELAESASKAKGEFLSNISHEIRTPLNAVVGLAYILKQSKLDSSQLEFVEKLENAGRGLIDLVSGVLQVGFVNLPVALQLVKAGRLKALAVTGTRRTPLLADVPTSASFYPQVDKLVDLGGGSYRWEMEKIGLPQISLPVRTASGDMLGLSLLGPAGSPRPHPDFRRAAMSAAGPSQGANCAPSGGSAAAPAASVGAVQ